MDVQSVLQKILDTNDDNDDYSSSDSGDNDEDIVHKRGNTSNIGQGVSDISLSSDDDSDSDSEDDSMPAPETNVTWSKHLRRPNVKQFDQEVGASFEMGPNKKEKDFWGKFFPESLVTKLVEETNKYAEKVNSTAAKSDTKWVPTCFLEIMAFLGIHIIFFSDRSPFKRNAIKGAKLKTRGESLTMQKGDLVATAWKDKKLLTYISTSCDPTQNKFFQKRQKDGTKKDIPAPSVSEQYNKYMFGVDLADQKRIQYCTCRKAKKWYKFLFWFCFDLALSHLHERVAKPRAKNRKWERRRSQLEFRQSLARQMIGGYRGTSKPKALSVIDYCGSAHWPTQLSKRRRCKDCSKDGKRHEVSIGCMQCNIRLCIKFDCFFKYHRELILTNEKRLRLAIDVDWIMNIIYWFNGESIWRIMYNDEARQETRLIASSTFDLSQITDVNIDFINGYLYFVGVAKYQNIMDRTWQHDMYCFKLYTIGESSSKPCQLKKIPIGNSQFLTMTMDMFNLKVYIYRDLRDSFGKKLADTLEGMTIDAENLKTLDKDDNMYPQILTLTVFDGELYAMSINVILSLAGIRTPSEVYSWVIVLVLPLNAAINPFIYTFSKLDTIKF
ncbi:LOW QUALITY PROTEIN: hypothetical protein KUTeg_009154 [Tegillarca granosa]|uniref:PiggyBac transposable element-derived protein domain-containing protein n=1 Tax=Tegillarca granosa TaxID=220873 RepID=A0ABQ9F7P2_TEGGR|nr:LOW QUALITY PROTEIN: hypothetical protein KUTeg_009154 [Tegillarca granosa]